MSGMPLTRADLRLIEQYVTERFVPWLAKATTEELPEDEIIGTLFYVREVLARPERVVEIGLETERREKELVRLREEP